MMNHEDYGMVRPDCLDSLDLYVKEGIPTGGFLEAVLCNDLMEAFGHADMFNRETLYDICRYVYNELPSACHGSPEKVREWLKRKMEERREKEKVS
jgi:hypothetical protein